MPGGWEWLIIIGVLVLLFGAKRLPEMARSVGQSARVFKGEMKGLRDDDNRGAPPQQQPRAAELPPANGQQYNGQQYAAGNGAVDGVANPQPTEPVRRDADR
jgi:TatA/E family protein of Tat protein translocase